MHRPGPPPQPSDLPAKPPARDGFTLVELLAVIAIIALLTVMATPAVTTILRGSRLTQAGQMLVDELALAKQNALTKNCNVEVRLYQIADPTVPGEQASQPGTGRYRALQTFAATRPAAGSSTPVYVAVDKVRLLPASIIIDSGSTLSSLIGGAADSSSTPAKVSATTSSTPIPQVGTSYNYVAFHFTPGGATDLPAAAQWFLTLHSLNDGDALASPPKNFFTVQINSTNGHLRSFRP